MKGYINKIRVRSSVQMLIGPGSLISPVLDKNCQTNRNPKTPKIGGKIFGEFFFQNSPKAPCALPPLRLVLTAMLLISYVWCCVFSRLNFETKLWEAKTPSHFFNCQTLEISFWLFRIKFCTVKELFNPTRRTFRNVSLSNSG